MRLRRQVISAPPRRVVSSMSAARALLCLFAALTSAFVAFACASERPLPSELAPSPAPLATARPSSDPPWTNTPTLDSVPPGPVRGAFAKRHFKLDELRLERNGLGEVVLLGKTSDENVTVQLPVMLAPQENLCVRRKMGRTAAGRIVVFRGEERHYSIEFAYVLQIDHASLAPYVPWSQRRGQPLAHEGQRLGTVSGRLLAMFDDERGWIGGHFKDIPVTQTADLGTFEPCSKGPVPGWLGYGDGYRADRAPRVVNVKPGPVGGMIGKAHFDARGVVLVPRFASNSDRPGWSLLFSSTSLRGDLLPMLTEMVPGSGLRSNSNVTVELDEEPRAGTCIERTADYAYYIPQMDPPHVQLSITTYVPPKPDAPGRMSGAVVLDWMEGSYIMGTFTDAPVHHPDSEQMRKGKPVIAPERCDEPAR